MFIAHSKGFEQVFTPPGSSEDYVRSPVSLSLIREDVEGFRPTGESHTSDLLMRVAVSRAIKAFKLPELVKLLHLNDVFKSDLPIWSSSPGLPWIQQGYKNKAAIRDDPDAQLFVRWFWSRVKLGKTVYPNDCCAFVRTQLAKVGDVKCRTDWDYPATVVFGEAVFALSLIKAYSRVNSPIAYGCETGVDGMKKIYESFKGHHFLRVDYKSFDKTTPEWLIRIAFNVLLLNLNLLEYEDYGVTHVNLIIRMWKFIIDYFINTPIRLCNGERYRKKGGIASGSYFTQLIGSIVNYILITYVSLKESNPIVSIKVLGDDSICGFERPIDPSDVMKHLEPLGFIVNVEKSGSSSSISDLSFLGRQINGDFPLK